MSFWYVLWYVVQCFIGNCCVVFCCAVLYCVVLCCEFMTNLIVLNSFALHHYLHYQRILWCLCISFPLITTFYIHYFFRYLLLYDSGVLGPFTLSSLTSLHPVSYLIPPYLTKSHRILPYLTESAAHGIRPRAGAVYESRGSHPCFPSAPPSVRYELTGTYATLHHTVPY